MEDEFNIQNLKDKVKAIKPIYLIIALVAFFFVVGILIGYTYGGRLYYDLQKGYYENYMALKCICSNATVTKHTFIPVIH